MREPSQVVLPGPQVLPVANHQVEEGTAVDSGCWTSPESLLDALQALHAQQQGHGYGCLAYVAAVAAEDEKSEKLHSRLVKQCAEAAGEGALAGVLVHCRTCVAHMLEGRVSCLVAFLRELAEVFGSPNGSSGGGDDTQDSGGRGRNGNSEPGDEDTSADQIRVLLFIEDLPQRSFTNWRFIKQISAPKRAGDAQAGSGGASTTAAAAVSALRQLAVGTDVGAELDLPELANLDGLLSGKFKALPTPQELVDLIAAD